MHTSEIDLVQYAKRFFSKWKRTGKGILVCCPFHDDHDPSLYVTIDYAYCFACGKGWSPQDFVKIINGEHMPLRQPRRQNKKRHISPSPDLVIRAHKQLMALPKKISLLEKRGIQLHIIEKFQIGYIVPPISNCSLPRFTFPTWNTKGELQTITYRQDPSIDYPDVPNENRKYLHHPGAEIIPYNIHSIHNYSWLVYTGGQIDALSLLQYNIPAVGAPGEGIFKKEWIDYFHDKKVLIWLDADDVGKKGAQKIHKMLKNSIVVDWPQGVPSKYDVNEAICDPLFGIKEIRRILHTYYARLR
jgi:DNA primase